MEERQLGRANRRVQSTYDKASERYDAGYEQGAKAARFLKMEAPMRALLREGHCLDVGCGTGRLLDKTPQSNVGVDVSAGMLAKAQSRGARVLLADALHLPFADKEFQSVIAANGVIRYIDWPGFLAEAGRVLKPRGNLVVHTYPKTTWSKKSLFSPRAPLDSRHIDASSELTEPAQDAGFAVKNLWLWRNLRFAPYALRLPNRLPGRFWSHCVLHLQLGKS